MTLRWANRFGAGVVGLGVVDEPGRFRIVTTFDPPDEAILRVVREVDGRLMVAGVRTSHPLAERLFGSVTHALVRDSDIPIFLST